VPSEEMLMILQEKLDTLAGEFNTHVKEEETRWDSFIKVQEDNTVGLKVLAESMTAHAKATEGLVETWRTVNALQRFLKWASSFAIIGAVIAWTSQKFFPT